MLRDPNARLVRIHSKLTVVVSGRPGPAHPFNCSQLGPPKANIPWALAISLRSGDDDAHPSKIQIPTKQSKAPPSGTGTTSSACSRPRSPLAQTSPLCYTRAPPPAACFRTALRRHSPPRRRRLLPWTMPGSSPSPTSSPGPSPSSPMSRSGSGHDHQLLLLGF